MDKLSIVKSCELEDYLTVQIKFLDTQRTAITDFISQTAKVLWDNPSQTQIYISAQVWQTDFMTQEIAPYPLCLPAETPYKQISERSNIVKFDTTLEIETSIASLDVNCYLVLDIYQTTVSQDTPELLGGTSLQLFDQETGLIKEGKLELTVWPGKQGDPENTPHTGRRGGDSGDGLALKNPLKYQKNVENSEKLAFIEKQQILQDQGVLPSIDWLDRLTQSKIQQVKDENRSSEFLYLAVAFPKFCTKNAETGFLTYPTVVYWRESEPELSIFTNVYEDIRRKIARSNKSNVRPGAQDKLELDKIIHLPVGIELSEDERNTIWNFKDYLAANSSSSIVRFCESVRWNSADKSSKIDDRNDIEERKIAQGLIESWLKPDMESLLQLLHFEELFIRKYAVTKLDEICNDEDLDQFLLQLVQAINFEGNFDAGSGFSNSDGYISSDGYEESSIDFMPLSKFLIDRISRSIQNVLTTNFYWYMKVESENDRKKGKKYQFILTKFNESLKSENSKAFGIQERQEKLVADLLAAMTQVREMGGDREVRQKLLRDLLSANSWNTDFMGEDNPLPFPLNPKILITGIVGSKTILFKSALAPARIVFKTANKKRPTYSVILKIGDDLRQDQLVVQMINLMNQTLKQDNLDLNLTPYNVIALTTNTGGQPAGFIECIPDATGLADIFKDYESSVLKYLTDTKYKNSSDRMDKYIKSCAGYCIITYLLGIGDRHFDNLMMTKDGKIFHIDFGFILGRDPKPFPPPMKLSKEMMEPMVPGSAYHKQFKNYCFTAFLSLRRQSNLFLSIMQLMQSSDIPDIALEPEKCLLTVQQNFVLSKDEDQAVAHVQNLLDQSLNAVFAVMVEELHKLAMYFRR